MTTGGPGFTGDGSLALPIVGVLSSCTLSENKGICGCCDLKLVGGLEAFGAVDQLSDPRIKSHRQLHTLRDIGEFDADKAQWHSSAGDRLKQLDQGLNELRLIPDIVCLPPVCCGARRYFKDEGL